MFPACVFQVVTLRTVHEKLLLLLPGGKQQALTSDRVFEPFSGLNPLHYNPYTEVASISRYYWTSFTWIDLKFLMTVVRCCSFSSLFGGQRWLSLSAWCRRQSRKSPADWRATSQTCRTTHNRYKTLYNTVYQCLWMVETHPMCRRVLVCCPAAAGVSKAQGADQTPHHQQRASVRTRDPAGQTAGLQQRFNPLSQNIFFQNKQECSPL